MGKFWKAIPWLLGAIWTPIAVAAPLPPAGRFVYSNACSSPDGDFEGYRVRLTASPVGVSVMVEYSDDGSESLDTVRDPTFNPTSGALNFSFRGGDGDQYSFHGTASLEKLVGTFDVKRSGATSIRADPESIESC
jgi:hypothetical protein